MLDQLYNTINFKSFYGCFRSFIVILQYFLFSFCAFCGWYLIEVEDKYLDSLYLNYFIINFIFLPLTLFSHIQCMTTEPGFIDSNLINPFYAQLCHLIYVLSRIETVINNDNIEDNYNDKHLSDNLYKIKENIYFLEKYFINSEKEFNSLNKSLSLIQDSSFKIKFRENTDNIDKILKNLSESFKLFFNNECSVCKNFKYEKTHHCSVCQKCVVKMDHHCPWIINCIGAKTEKAFILFNLYLFITCFYYSIVTLYYYIIPQYVFDQHLKNPNFIFVTFSLYLSGGFSTFAAFMLISTLKYVISNSSTIDSMQNKYFEKRNLFSSLVDTCGTKNIFMWFLPFTHNIMHGKIICIIERINEFLNKILLSKRI